MAELLMSSPLLTVFLVVALGAALGIVPFGPLRFGAAGALFVGLAVGNIVPEMGASLGLIQNLGLALFVYTVGLSAGQTFFADLKRQSGLMVAGSAILAIGAGVAIGVSKLLGLSAELSSGVFAGALTTTPALAAASAQTGNDIPGVGYSLGYPVGVVISIILVSVIVSKRWPEPNDTPSLAGQTLHAETAIVKNEMSVRDVPGWQDQDVRLSYLQRGDNTRVISPGEELLPDDRVVVVGAKADVLKAIDAIGECVPEHLADDRSIVDFRSFTVSNKGLAGRSVAELNMVGRFGALITRIHRGDLELLAADDALLELGDRVMIAYPRAEHDAIERYMGNSEGKISEVDAISMGVGLVLGLLLGMVEISLPGGSSFSLGSAAGPLIVGMILGALRRTGPLVWQMPMAANRTIRQLGLLLFLAAVGIASGPAFIKTAPTMLGLKSGIVALAIAVVVVGLTALAGRMLGISAQRTAGAMAGVLGQPAILAFASSKENDERIESGYAALFALGIIVKIMLVSVILAF